ncbi:MAG TPA: hypothetical protein VER12_04130 [Polyangiaceae bacterium]|nr:hypothetical protein [Polyangiaceae bacterium]
MSERYLQSLAILLAGLFSAESPRGRGFSLELPSPSPEPKPSHFEAGDFDAEEHRARSSN